MTTNFVQVGVDLGGTKVHSVVLGDEMNVLAQDTRLSGFGPTEVFRNLRDSIQEALSGISAASVSSIGIGTPGTVDSGAGVVRHSLNLGIESMDLRSLISDQFHCAVQVENDVNATAFGLAKIFPQYDSLCYLNFGTGLAAGFVINGKVWSGASGLAGEIGHIPVGGKSDPCSCGQVGCLEIYSSWSGMRRNLSHYETAGDAWEKTASDPRSQKTWDEFVESAVFSIQTIFLTLDPEVIFIGGGVVSSGPQALPRIVEALQGLEAKAPLFAEKRVSERIRAMPKDVPVAAIGALG